MRTYQLQKISVELKRIKTNTTRCSIAILCYSMFNSEIHSCKKYNDTVTQTQFANMLLGKKLRLQTQNYILR